MGHMGRPKGYDRTQVLERAMELFWRQGFEKTSTQQLVEHLGINRNSMYSEFGTKRQFYETALAHYESLWITKNFGALEGPEAGIPSILAIFEHYAAIGKGRRSGMGCMLTNASVELGAYDPPSQEISDDYISRVSAAFENALQGGKAAGMIRSDVDVGQEARFLTSTWLGMLVLARAKAPAPMLDAVPVVVRNHLTSLGA